MAENTAGAIIPFLRYDNAVDAIAWLELAFGFERQMVVPGPAGTVAHAQLTFEGATIMLGSPSDDGFGIKSPTEAGGVTQGIYVVVDDVDAHFRRAQNGGADIVKELADTDYGSREYMARDVEGHLWSFGTYRPGGEG